MALCCGGGGYGPPAQAAGLFPLSWSQRHVLSARGTPLLIQGDAAWSIVGQLTNAQIDTYLDDRASRGFNAILFNAPEPYYTSQTPSYRNVDGVDPFDPATSFTNPVEAYWQRVDYIVNQAKARGMVCIINPAYLGYQGDAGGTDGWGALGILSVTDATLQAYGNFLANRYTYGNVIWCSGGDEAGDSTVRDKLAKIIDGIRSVRTTDICTAHPSSTEDPYVSWSGYPWYTLNNTYCYETDAGADNFAYEAAATAYARSMPFIGFEFKYDGSTGATAAMLRRQSYGTMLSGGCGQIYGNLPVWNFESARWTGETWSGTWQDHLGDTGAIEQGHLRALLLAYQWWKLEPRTDASLVTSSISSDAARLFPALASDGSFALIYVPSSQSVTVNTSALTGVTGNVRIRLFDPTTGAYSTVAASEAKSSSRSVATGGERVIVLDAA